MTRMSLGEELDLLFKVCLQNKLSIVIFLLLAIVAYLFITTNKRNANVTKKTYIIACFGNLNLKKTFAFIKKEKSQNSVWRLFYSELL